MRNHHARRSAGPLLCLLSFAFAGAVAAAPIGVTGVTPRPAYLDQRVGVELDEVIVRFEPSSGVRAEGGALVSTNATDLSQLRAVLGSVSVLSIEPRFPQSAERLDALRARAEARSGHAVADLNLFVTLRLPKAPTEEIARFRADQLLAQLEARPEVAEAWLSPQSRPASLWTRDGAASARGGSPSPSGTTPDFSSQQGYLYAAPSGVEAVSAWAQAGGLGQDVDMIDIEWGWYFDHEDLKTPFYVAGDLGTDDHGTAVLGEIAGQHNGYGVNGISPEVRIGGISLNTFSIPGAIAEAASVLDPGDVFLMEVQCSGPENWMPCEWWSDVYAAIDLATAAGVICVEAGGNGTINLDDPLYGNLFDRRLRDSNAIMIGAGTPTGLTAEWFSNYGGRVDLQGWGSSIVTTGYGDLQGGPQGEWYTAGFSGTSGASPIVVGSVCSLQGQARALFGASLTPDLAEEILGSTGSDWAGDRQIGERPNLAAARARLELGWGDLDVLVRDGDTHDPMPDIVLQIVETGRLDKTGPAGTTSMQLSATSMTIRAEGNFYYPSVDAPVTVLAGQTQSITIDLYRAPSGTLAGRVRDQLGNGLNNAKVELLGTPLSPVSTNPLGDYSLPGVPAHLGYTALAHGPAARGVGYKVLDITGNQTTTWNPILIDAQSFEGSNGGYTPTNDWEWGTPTYPPQAPPPVHSGAKLWGTKLGTSYSDLTISTLTSPTVSTTGAPQVYLTFYHWYWVDPEDGGQVQVWDAPNNRWVVAQPIGGYPDPSIVVLSNTGGYNGHTTEHIPAVFDLTAWSGPGFKFRLYFRSTISGHKLGWYVDDIALDLGQSIVAIEDMVPGTELDSGLTLLSAGPSPTVGPSVLRFSLAGESEVRFDVVDVRGQRVHESGPARVAAGVHEIRWDGRSSLGELVPAGVYYWRLMAGERETTGRIVRVR